MPKNHEFIEVVQMLLLMYFMDYLQHYNLFPLHIFMRSTNNFMKWAPNILNSHFIQYFLLSEGSTSYYNNDYQSMVGT